MKNVPLNWIKHHATLTDINVVDLVYLNTWNPVRNDIFDEIGRQVYEKIWLQLKGVS